MFTLQKPFSIRGREVKTQLDLDRTHLDPADESVKDAIKKGFIAQNKQLGSGETKSK